MAKIDFDDIKEGCKQKFTAVIFFGIVIILLETILILNIELINKANPECANDGYCQQNGLDKCALYYDH